MSDDKLSFLDSEQSEDKAKAKDEPTQENAEDQSVEPVEEPKAETPEESKGEDDAAPPAEEPEPKHIPVTALLDEREKRQAAQRAAEEAERKYKELERRLHEAQQPKEEPDFYADPDAALRAREAQWEQRMLAQKLQTSRFLAEREFGADLVNEAYAYFDQHPEESQAMLGQPSPFHAAVEHYKRQKFLAEVQDPDKWREKQLEEMRQQLAQESAVPPKPKVPPASLAKAPASGGDPKSSGNAFDDVFG